MSATPAGSTMYEFRLDGRLPEHSREAFCGMDVEEIPPRVVLRGAVIDEPHLLGILDQLRMLGLSLVSVRPLTGPDRAAKPIRPDPGPGVPRP